MTEIWSVSPSADMLLFGVTIPVTVPQRSEIPEGLMKYPVYIFYRKTIIFYNAARFGLYD